MSANSNLLLTGLDFDSLRANFIQYLSSQQDFKDYDITSSNFSVLLDIFAYNTHLNAFYTNMMLSESFLDSAQLKTSVVSHAKELNYTPRSVRSAEANVNITFQGPEPTYLLQKGQTFSSTIKSNTYNFSIPDNILLTSTNGYFSANVSLFEGVYLYDTYVFNSSDPTQRLILSNENCDVSSLTVVVYEDNNINGTPYTYATTLLDLDENSKVFFVQQAENLKYEVIFGDGVVGYKPKDGSTISLNYRISHGSDGNGAKLFTINFNPGPTSDASQINVQTISVSGGGANAEDIESIRYFAPRHFQVQEHASAANDYSIMLREQFPEISAVSVFGGEELFPPQYGYVAIAIDIADVDGLPDSKIQAYKQFLTRRNSLTTQITFVNPLFSYLAIHSTVSYNINKTTLTPENIKTIVLYGIQQYALDNFGDFSSKFRYSRFCSMIDNIDNSLIGNETDVLLYKKIFPTEGMSQNIDIDFATKLQPGVVQPNNTTSTDYHTFYSGNFYMNGYVSRLEDDGKGNVFIVNKTQGGVETFVSNVGSINYNTGLVKLINFKPTNYDGSSIKLYVRPLELDIIANKATILNIEEDEINITVDIVRE